MKTTLVGLPPAPARIAFKTVDIGGLWWKQPVGLIRRWLLNAGYEVLSDGVDADAYVTVYLQHDVDATLQLVASGVPYVVVLTEQPHHFTWTDPVHVMYVGGAAAVWAMDAGDAAMVAARPGPCPQLAIVPCMVGTYFDPAIPVGDLPVDVTGRIVMHLGTPSSMPTYRDRIVAAVQAAAEATGAVFDNVQGVFHEPERSLRLSTADTIVVVNREPNPALYTVHRLGFMLRARRPGSVIFVDECDPALNVAWTRVLSAMDPVVQLVPGPDMPVAVVSPTLRRPTAADEARVHTLLDRFFTWDGTTDWVANVLQPQCPGTSAPSGPSPPCTGP
jgi:hypothetical protein